jgi:hypothetical protein
VVVAFLEKIMRVENVTWFITGGDSSKILPFLPCACIEVKHLLFEGMIRWAAIRGLPPS